MNLREAIPKANACTTSMRDWYFNFCKEAEDFSASHYLSCSRGLDGLRDILPGLHMLPRKCPTSHAGFQPLGSFDASIPWLSGCLCRSGQGVFGTLGSSRFCPCTILESEVYML